uniref:Geminin coiled-coil domain containing n=1 Tax=Xiphophorus couchianus TaxID=32473 RepID=A0A3B5MCP5_9TELE
AFTPPAGLMWTQQLSPHLQRNKQLQDTLLQREEELARLQEENNKLRGFLSSSFVTNLQEKAKVGDWTEPAVMKDLLRFRCLIWMCSAEHIEFGPSFLSESESSLRDLVYGDAFGSPVSTPSSIHSYRQTAPLCFTSRSSSCTVLNKSQAPSGGCSASSSQSLHKPTDLAFSMSLSPSSSVKTHSFPQGQAFIRKDTGGRWNFTWVPRQEP